MADLKTFLVLLACFCLLGHLSVVTANPPGRCFICVKNISICWFICWICLCVPGAWCLYLWPFLGENKTNKLPDLAEMLPRVTFLLARRYHRRFKSGMRLFLTNKKRKQIEKKHGNQDRLPFRPFPQFGILIFFVCVANNNVIAGILVRV